MKRILREVLFFLNCTFWDKTGLYRFLPMNHVSHRMCTWLEVGAYWGDLRDPEDRDIVDVWRDGIGRVDSRG